MKFLKSTVILYLVTWTGTVFADECSIVDSLGVVSLAMCENSTGNVFHKNGHFAGSRGGNWFYSDGKLAGSATSNWFFSDGRLAGSIGGNWFHENGQLAGSTGGNWFYANGQFAGSSNGNWYSSSGKFVGSFGIDSEGQALKIVLTNALDN